MEAPRPGSARPSRKFLLTSGTGEEACWAVVLGPKSWARECISRIGMENEEVLRKKRSGRLRWNCAAMGASWSFLTACCVRVCACVHGRMRACTCTCMLLAGTGLTHLLRTSSDCSTDSRSCPGLWLPSPLTGKSARAKAAEERVAWGLKPALLHACSLQAGRPHCYLLIQKASSMRA